MPCTRRLCLLVFGIAVPAHVQGDVADTKSAIVRSVLSLHALAREQQLAALESIMTYVREHRLTDSALDQLYDAVKNGARYPDFETTKKAFGIMNRVAVAAGQQAFPYETFLEKFWQRARDRGLLVTEEGQQRVLANLVNIVLRRMSTIGVPVVARAIHLPSTETGLPVSTIRSPRPDSTLAAAATSGAVGATYQHLAVTQGTHLSGDVTMSAGNLQETIQAGKSDITYDDGSASFAVKVGEFSNSPQATMVAQDETTGHVSELSAKNGHAVLAWREIEGSTDHTSQVLATEGYAATGSWSKEDSYEHTSQTYASKDYASIGSWDDSLAIGSEIDVAPDSIDINSLDDYSGVNVRIGNRSASNFVGIGGEVSDEYLLKVTGDTQVTGNLNIGGVCNVTPVGTTIAFAGATAPSGFLACNGLSYNSVTHPEYANLYTAIGTTYGGTGPTNFNVPNLAAPFTHGRYAIKY